jgi:DNA-binding transcriptional regulator GbsR (MarR family)
VIDQYGWKHQVQKALEELEELQVELRLALQSEGIRENLVSETADVYNMLEQLKIIFDMNNDELATIMVAKMRRACNESS